VFSFDGHVGGPPETYLPYIDPRYRADLEALSAENAEWSGFTKFYGFERGQKYGVFDAPRLLEEMDADGIAGQILLNGHGMAGARRPPPAPPGPPRGRGPPPAAPRFPPPAAGAASCRPPPGPRASPRRGRWRTGAWCGRRAPAAFPPPAGGPPRRPRRTTTRT